MAELIFFGGLVLGALFLDKRQRKVALCPECNVHCEVEKPNGKRAKRGCVCICVECENFYVYNGYNRELIDDSNIQERMQY